MKSKFIVGLSALLASNVASNAWAKPAQIQEQEVALRGPSGALEVIADSQEITAASPNGETPYSLFVGLGTGIYPQINQRGDVLFPAQMWNGNPVENTATHLYRYRSGQGIRYLLGDNDSLQGMGTDISADLTSAFNLQYKPSITGDGQALTMCRLSGPGINSGNQLGVVRAQQGAASELAAQNQTPLGTIPIHSILGAIEPENRPDEQLVAASLNASASQSVILRRSANGIEQIARTGDRAPGTGGAQFGVFPYPLQTVRHVNDNGVAAFGVMLVGNGVNGSNNGALYRYRNGTLEIVARDGQIAEGAASDCAVYSSAYSKFNMNSSGKIVLNAGLSCTGGHAVYSDRSGVLKLEAIAGKVFDSPSGRFRIGLLNELTTVAGTIGDSPHYLKSFLADNGDLYILTSLFHENNAVRSTWAIVRIKLNGSAEVALESSGAFSQLGLSLANVPFPEQVSLARDGSLLVRAEDQASNAKVLIRSVPNQTLSIVRDGDVVDGYVVTVGGGNHVSGVALPSGKSLAMVSARAVGDDQNAAPRPAILAMSSSGQLSLPVVRGISLVRFASGESGVIQNFDEPFTYTLKRKVANDAGQLTFVAIVQRSGVGAEQVVALLPASSPSINPADFNQDGVVNPADIFAFLSAHFAHDMRADADGDSVLSTNDIFAFLAIYFAA